MEFTKNTSQFPAQLMVHCIMAFCTIPVIKHPIKNAKTAPHFVTLYRLK